MSRTARTIVQTIVLIVETILFTELFRIGGAWAEIRWLLELRMFAKLPPARQLDVLQHHMSLTHLPPVIIWHMKPTFDYVANGPIFAGALLVIILLFLALRKRLHPWALLAIMAFVLAFGYSLYAHSGFIPLGNS